MPASAIYIVTTLASKQSQMKMVSSLETFMERFRVNNLSRDRVCVALVADNAKVHQHHALPPRRAWSDHDSDMMERRSRLAFPPQRGAFNPNGPTTVGNYYTSKYLSSSSNKKSHHRKTLSRWNDSYERGRNGKDDGPPQVCNTSPTSPTRRYSSDELLVPLQAGNIKNMEDHC